MKKTLSFLLSILFILSSSVNAHAVKTINNPQTQDIHTAAIQIQQSIPSAQVRVENNVMYIVVSDPSQIPGFNSVLRTTGEESDIGGSYRNFRTSAFATFYPSSQVYMPKNVVDALDLYLTSPSIYTFIVNKLGEGLLHAAIVSLVYQQYGIAITTGVVAVIADWGSSFLYWAISNAEHWAINAAQEQEGNTEGKVSVVRGITSDGYQQYYYYPWIGNDCPTYNGYNATWYEGIYDVPQA